MASSSARIDNHFGAEPDSGTAMPGDVPPWVLLAAVVAMIVVTAVVVRKK